MSIVHRLRQGPKRFWPAIHLYRMIEVVCLDPLNRGRGPNRSRTI
ncbi:MAG TPA: hypothetical protein V6D23_17425 [Candidatus Obscuribacterales bacterium]